MTASILKQDHNTKEAKKNAVLTRQHKTRCLLLHVGCLKQRSFLTSHVFWHQKQNKKAWPQHESENSSLFEFVEEIGSPKTWPHKT